jgi:hypothetical protein
VFEVDNRGNATFAGMLTAPTTEFIKLKGGQTMINYSSYWSTFDNMGIRLAVGTDTADNQGNHEYGGYLEIGRPLQDGFDDVTISASVIRERVNQTGYGNLGTVR